MTAVELLVGEMTTIEAKEFLFVEELPKREKTRWQKVWDHFEEMKRITDEKGMLVPLKLAAKVAGVSYQRIQDLCELGTLERVEMNGHPFITEDTLVAWAKSERKSGRPLKTPEGKLGMLKVCKDFAKEHVGIKAKK